MKWKGVIPAITTCFDEKDQVDHAFVADHCRWLIENGCAGIVALGSLGEGATLSFDEKLAVLRTCVNALHGRASVTASISSLTTAEAVALAKAARRNWLRRADDSSAVRLQRRLARDEDACHRRPEGDGSFRHALQQSRSRTARISFRSTFRSSRASTATCTP